MIRTLIKPELQLRKLTVIMDLVIRIPSKVFDFTYNSCSAICLILFYSLSTIIDFKNPK